MAEEKPTQKGWVCQAYENSRTNELAGGKPERRGSPYWQRFLLIAGLALMHPMEGGCADNNVTNQDVVEDAAEDEVDADVEDGETEADAEIEADAPEEGIVDVTEDLVLEDDADTPEDAGCRVLEREYLVDNPQPDVGDPSDGGSTQTQVLHYMVTERIGPGCEASSTEPVLSEIEYVFEPPLPEDFSAAVRMGILTSNLDDAVNHKVIGRETDCIITGRIINGARIGRGMPTAEVSDGMYFVMFSTVGETSGLKWVDVSIWNIRRGDWVRDERVNEGSLFMLPNGNRGMPTGIDIAGHTVRMDILEPTDYRLCEGMRIIRESDEMAFVFRQNLPEGWSFFPE